MSRALARATFGLLVCGAPRVAGAAPSDPAPERLTTEPPGLPPGVSCRDVARDPELAVAAGVAPASLACLPDEAAFRGLVGELGVAAAPVAGSARTDGAAHFAIAAEARFTSASGGAHLARGLAGDGTGAPDAPNGFGYVGLAARKGLPLGLELGVALGHLTRTSLAVLGADVRASLLEGLARGPLAWLPDVSLGVSTRLVAGSAATRLGVISFEGRASKDFAVAGAVLTPFAAWQRVLVLAETTGVDLTPDVDAVARCGSAAPGATPCPRTLSNGAPDDGDRANVARFGPLTVHRNRALAGAAYRYANVRTSAQLGVDVTDPRAEGNGGGFGRQWVVAFDAGWVF